MTKIRVWVEVMTTVRFNEFTCETPADWESMDDAAREAYMQSVFESERDNACNGGWEVVEEDADDAEYAERL